MLSKRNILEPLHRRSCEKIIYLPVETTFSHHHSPWYAMDRGKRLHTFLHAHERTRVSRYQSRCVGDLARTIFMHIYGNLFRPLPFALVRDGPRQAPKHIFGTDLSERASLVIKAAASAILGEPFLCTSMAITYRHCRSPWYAMDRSSKQAHWHENAPLPPPTPPPGRAAWQSRR